jgi:hypothetical protein
MGNTIPHCMSRSGSRHFKDIYHHFYKHTMNELPVSIVMPADQGT